MRRRHEPERDEKRVERERQGWAQQRPLTRREATHNREGFPYVRDEHGVIRVDRSRREEKAKAA